MIEAENVTYTYPQGGAPALADFSACFKRGEITAVRGRNGSGKTTLTKLIAGILRPDSGRILIDGEDTAALSLFETGKRVGYLFQNPLRQLFCDTVWNEVAFGLRNSGLSEDDTAERTERYLEYFGLERYRGSFPGKLSLGERQRLALAAVLSLGAGHLVLDEPTTGLDMCARRELSDMLRGLRDETGCGILLVSHEADFLESLADRELVMA